LSRPRAEKLPLRTKKTASRVGPWILVLAIAGGAVYLYPRVDLPKARRKQDKRQGKGGRGRGSMTAPFPVVAAAARRGYMPVYIYNGIGHGCSAQAPSL